VVMKKALAPPSYHLVTFPLLRWGARPQKHLGEDLFEFFSVG